MHPNPQTKTIRVISITLMVTALLMVGSRYAGAQSEQAQKAPQSLEELKKRLLQRDGTVAEAIRRAIQPECTRSRRSVHWHVEEHVCHANQFRSVRCKSCECERYDRTQ
jgi:hypothetical protein